MTSLLKLVRKKSEADITRDNLKKTLKEEAKRRMEAKWTLSIFVGMVAKLQGVDRGDNLRLTLKVLGSKLKLSFPYEPGGTCVDCCVVLSALFALTLSICLC